MSVGGGADGEYRCFVGGLAWATDDRALQAAFRQFGEVVESKVISDRETGRSRGFGFVTFGEEKAMRDAIECMNGKDLDGRSITVNQAQSRSSGGGGRGGFRRPEGGRFGNGGYNEERRGYGGRGGGGSYGGKERGYGGGGARAMYSVGGGGGGKYGGPLDQGNWRK